VGDAPVMDRRVPGPIRLGLLGSGVEASAHVAAAAHVRTLAKVTVFSPTRSRRESFAASVRQQFGVECTAVESAADVLIAAARSRNESPILHAHMLRPGMLAVSIGSTLTTRCSAMTGAPKAPAVLLVR
jgi:ornithine cyclodeaminase/alanine dehydrogenase-like protein (mu-crystallin family)